MPGGRRRHAEEGLGDVAAPGADEAGDAEDLAGAHVEGDVVEDAVEVRGPCTDSTTSPIGTVSFGKHLGDLAADHHADDVVARHVAWSACVPM